MKLLLVESCQLLARFLACVSIACSAQLAAAASCPGSTFAFSICDDFNGTALDTTVWKHISASRGENTQGQTATVHDGYLDLVMNQTDNGGAVVARFAPQRHLKVTLTHNMHPANNNFMPAVLLESSAGMYVTHMNWLRSSYAPDYCSKTGAYDKVRLVVDTTAAWCSTAVFSTNSSSGYFDRWTTAVMEYDKDSGLVTVDLDNNGTLDMQATVPAVLRKGITGVSLQPFGWYTGHWHRIDSVRIEGTPTSGSPPPVPVVPLTPTLNVSPSGVVLTPGSTVKLSVPSQQTGVSYELCLGANATVFDLVCVPLPATGMVVPVASGWDFYAAARSIAGAVMSGFSSPIHIQSATDSATAGGAWIPGRLGSDFDHARRVGNAAPTLQLVVGATGSVRPGQIVSIEAQTTDPDSSNLFFHWFATEGDFRPKVSNFKSVEWRAPTTAGRYIIKGGVGDGDGNARRAYILITVQ